MNVGAIVLAAGESKRLGKPKQLLRYHGKSLLRRAAEVALESVCEPVVVVLGYEATRMRRELNGLPVLIVENPNWRDGIGASIRSGIDELGDTTKVSGAVIMVCDQTHVTPQVINALVDTQQMAATPIVAAAYGGTLGVPALFAREMFPDLMALEPESGAKRVIEQYIDRVAQIEFPDGAIDIDTPEDSAGMETE